MRLWEERITRDEGRPTRPRKKRYRVVSDGARTIQGGSRETSHPTLFAARCEALFAVVRGDGRVRVVDGDPTAEGASTAGR